MPVAVRFLIDKGLAAEDAATIDGYFVALFGVALLFGLFAALRFYLVTWLGERVVADLSVSDVASIMGRREGSVRVLVHRGLKQLGSDSAVTKTRDETMSST